MLASAVRCRLAYGLADANVSCFSKIQIRFTFLVPTQLGSPGQRAVKRVCMGLECPKSPFVTMAMALGNMDITCIEVWF